jgi:O-antigen ligase
MKLLLALFIWIVFTSFFSYNIDVSFEWLRRILAVYLLCLSVHQIAKNKDYIPWTYLIWVVMYVTCLLYAREMIATNKLDYTTNRVSDANLNANTLAYFTFFITYILFYWGNSKRRIGKLCRIAFLLIIPLSFYVALITASRQVLLIQIPLIAFLLFIRYIKGKGGVSATIFILFLVLSAFFVASSVSQLYDSSLLAQRAQVDFDEDIRMALIRDGLKTGVDNVLTGVGIGCMGLYYYGHATFAHNTYIELFATTGIVGALIFIYMMLSFIFTQYKRYRKIKKIDYLIFMFICIIYAIDNMFYVFHTDPWLMAFFILVTSHAEMTYKNDMVRKK